MSRSRSRRGRRRGGRPSEAVARSRCSATVVGKVRAAADGQLALRRGVAIDARQRRRTVDIPVVVEVAPADVEARESLDVGASIIVRGTARAPSRGSVPCWCSSPRGESRSSTAPRRRPRRDLGPARGLVVATVRSSRTRRGAHPRARGRRHLCRHAALDAAMKASPRCRTSPRSRARTARSSSGSPSPRPPRCGGRRGGAGRLRPRGARRLRPARHPRAERRARRDDGRDRDARGAPRAGRAPACRCCRSPSRSCSSSIRGSRRRSASRCRRSATASLLLFARPLARRTRRAGCRVPSRSRSPCRSPRSSRADRCSCSSRRRCRCTACSRICSPAPPRRSPRWSGSPRASRRPCPVLRDGLAALAWLPASWIAATAATITPISRRHAAVDRGLAGCGRCSRVVGLAVGIGDRAQRRRARRRAPTLRRHRRRSSSRSPSASAAALPRSDRSAGRWTLPAGWTVLACDVGQGDAVLVALGRRGHARRHRPRPGAARGLPRPRRDRRASTCSCSPTSISTTSGEWPPVIGHGRHRPARAPVHGEESGVLADARGRGCAARRRRTRGMTGTLGEARWRVLWPRAESRAFPSGNDASVVIDVRGGGVPPRAAARRPVGRRRSARSRHPALLDPPYDDRQGRAPRQRGPGCRVSTALRRRWSRSSPSALGNDYGHPRDETLAILDEIGARRRCAPTCEGVRRGLAGHRTGGSCGASAPAPSAAALARLVGMAQTSARAPAAKTRSAIPQLSWRDPQPAPIVLVSGPEEVCAERAIAGVRDYLRAEDPSLEVSDLRADDYTPGHAPRRHVAVAVRRAAPGAGLGRREVLRRVPHRGACRTSRSRRRGRPSSCATPVRPCAARSSSTRSAPARAAASRSPCPALKRDSDRFDFAAGEFQTAKKRIAPTALRALVSAFADDLTELAAACQQLIADVPGDITEQVVERYYGGRVETSAFTVADTAIAGRYGDALIALRHALASGADPVPLVAAVASKLRTMARVAGNRESAPAHSPRGSGSRTGRSIAPGATCPAGRRRRSGMAIQAAARADAEVKGGSRDPVFALERLVTVIATRAPYGLLTRRRGTRREHDDEGPSPAGTGLRTLRPVQRAAGSERRDLLGDGRLAVRRLVLVDDALAHGLVELLGRLARATSRPRPCRRRRWPRGCDAPRCAARS